MSKLAVKRADSLPEIYDPGAAIEGIRKLDALENYYIAAKDLEPLRDVITEKLKAQLRHVIWWDENVRPAGQGSINADRRYYSAEDAETLTDISQQQTSRWRKKLIPENKFEQTLDAALERCRRVCEMEKGSTDQKGASGTGENEWYTPDQYLDAARDVLGEIDLDPASSDAAQKKVNAKAHFTKETDGLAQDWHGRVWLNPPYAQPHIADFVSKLVGEVNVGRVSAAIMLTHNYTDNSWFHSAASIADAICFTRGRIRFYDNAGTLASPTQGQAFFYFGDDVDAFAERFSDIGVIMKPWHGEV